MSSGILNNGTGSRLRAVQKRPSASSNASGADPGRGPTTKSRAVPYKVGQSGLKKWVQARKERRRQVCGWAQPHKSPIWTILGATNNWPTPHNRICSKIVCGRVVCSAPKLSEAWVWTSQGSQPNPDRSVSVRDSGSLRGPRPPLSPSVDVHVSCPSRPPRTQRNSEPHVSSL